MIDFRRLLKYIVIGLVVSLVVISLRIFWAYYTAYDFQPRESYVQIFSMEIYKLVRGSDEYLGQANKKNLALVILIMTGIITGFLVALEKLRKS